jgi:hypothetical protein
MGVERVARLDFILDVAGNHLPTRTNRIPLPLAGRG